MLLDFFAAANDCVRSINQPAGRRSFVFLMVGSGRIRTLENIFNDL
jgi:hypothetical protein